MKQLLILAAGALALTACNNQAAENTAEDNVTLSESEADAAANDVAQSTENGLDTAGDSLSNVGNAFENTGEAAVNAVSNGAGAVANAADNVVTTESEAKAGSSKPAADAWNGRAGVLPSWPFCV